MRIECIDSLSIIFCYCIMVSIQYFIFFFNNNGRTLTIVQQSWTKKNFFPIENKTENWQLETDAEKKETDELTK